MKDSLGFPISLNRTVAAASSVSVAFMISLNDILVSSTGIITTDERSMVGGVFFLVFVI